MNRLHIFHINVDNETFSHSLIIANNFSSSCDLIYFPRFLHSSPPIIEQIVNNDLYPTLSPLKLLCVVCRPLSPPRVTPGQDHCLLKPAITPVNAALLPHIVHITLLETYQILFLLLFIGPQLSNLTP